MVVLELSAWVWAPLLGVALYTLKTLMRMPPGATAKPFSKAAYDASFPPPPARASAAALYVDMVKRSVLNLIYHETSPPCWFYGAERRAMFPQDGFDLARRAAGEDCPSNALSMVGWARLGNVADCVATTVREGVPGDYAEAGACKGGACILMRAVLAAEGVTDRNVWVLDTFCEPPAPAPPLVRIILTPLFLFLGAIASIPFRPWQFFLFRHLSKLSQSFPPVKDATDDEVGGRGVAVWWKDGVCVCVNVFAGVCVCCCQPTILPSSRPSLGALYCARTTRTRCVRATAMRATAM